MARPYRLQAENCLYHLTSRGDDRRQIFISAYDYQKFLEYLLQAKTKYNFYLYAYVLMNNHYHLLIETTQPNLSKIMHYINSAYTTYYNLKRHKSGHVFQGRYKSILVDKDNYLLELTRYIHLNPVRAKIVPKPEDYQWSSYLGYIQPAKDSSIDRKHLPADIHLDPQHYQAFVLEGLIQKNNPFKKVYAGFILGQTSFIQEKLKLLKEKVASQDFSYKDELNGRIEAKDILTAVSKKYALDLTGANKLKNKKSEGKKIAVYLLQRYSGLSNVEIGQIFGISFSAVSKATASIESLMVEDKGLKKEIEGLVSSFKG